MLVVEIFCLVVGDMCLVKSEDILSLGIRSHSGQMIFSIFSSHSSFCSGFENILSVPDSFSFSSTATTISVGF